LQVHLLKLIAEFIASTQNAKHVIYDAVSSSGLDAFETVYGESIG
jgi:hypothetical protein